MEKTKLDILLVQNDPKELYKALREIKSNRENILFSNCVSCLKVGNQYLNIQFDRAFYANKLVLVRRNCKIDNNDFKNILEEWNIKYQEVIFNDEDFEYKCRREIKNLYFPRGSESLINILEDSKKKGIEECNYYPYVEGVLRLKYFITNGSLEILDERYLKGLIELRDKLILLINQKEKRNVSMDKALKILRNEKLSVCIKEDTENIIGQNKVKQYRKDGGLWNTK